jgi:hypothetical protein
MKKTIAKIFLSLGLASLLSACFEERIIVNVNKQGAGTIEHASYNNVENMMSGLFSGLGELNSESSSKAKSTNYNDQFFAEKALQMGRGVTVKSWKIAKNTSGFEGYEAIYNYRDINTVSVSTSPGMQNRQGDNSASVDSSALEASHYFTMQNGKLVIHTPEPESEEKQAEASNQLNEAATQQMLAMMGAIFKGARVSVIVNALDPIVTSNARHRDDRQVTLMDVRLDELMSDPKLFTQAQNFNSLDRLQAQAMADKIEGIDVDTQAKIIIQF